MHRDWLITAVFLAFASVTFVASYEAGLLNLIVDYINRLIAPISTGILP